MLFYNQCSKSSIFTQEKKIETMIPTSENQNNNNESKYDDDDEKITRFTISER